MASFATASLDTSFETAAMDAALSETVTLDWAVCFAAACHTSKASRVSATSCARTIDAPLATATNEAEALAGAELFVDAEALCPLPEGVFYNYQLIGLKVVSARGETLGRVEDIVETGARDVIVVHGDRGEVLLPSIPQVIRRVDLEAGIIEVELLPGLLPETEENEETR